MSRRKKIKNNTVIKDYNYSNYLIGKTINYLMYSGKKSKAENILYKSFNIVIEKLNFNDVVVMFSRVVENLKPIVEVKSRKIGGNTYQIPIEVKKKRGVSLAIKWIILASRKRKEKNSIYKIAGELIDALYKRGSAYKKKNDIYKIAEANKAFSHYRW